MLPEQDLGEFFAQHFTQTAFRLERLPEYAVGTDGSDFQRWLDGAPEPTWERKNVFLDDLRADMAAGRRNFRVKVMSARPTDYERYACEWGYALNAQYEDIGILDLSTTRFPDELAGLHDFWLLDDQHVLVMVYDANGQFVGGEVAPDVDLPVYRAAHQAAMAAAEPFGAWWARRTDLRRPKRVA